MPQQNFKNHARLVTLYHFVLFLIILAILAMAVINLVNAVSLLSVMLPLMVAAILLTAYFARSFALKAQDRAIRAEENLRHYVLTGKLLSSELTMAQIIALRFAPDEEFVGLAQRAVKEGLDNKAIKQTINNWRADYHRA
jgi:hypothetical protein